MICFLEKFDLVGKCALFVNREKQNIEMLGPLSTNRNLTKTQHKRLETFCLQYLFHSVREHQPKWWFEMKSNPCFL